MTIRILPQKVSKLQRKITNITDEEENGAPYVKEISGRRIGMCAQRDVGWRRRSDSVLQDTRLRCRILPVITIMSVEGEFPFLLCVY